MSLIPLSWRWNGLGDKGVRRAVVGVRGEGWGGRCWLAKGHNAMLHCNPNPVALFSNLEENLPFFGYRAFTWFTNSGVMKTDKTQLCLSCELLSEVKTTYQNKHSLMLSNFFFYIIYFLGNEKSKLFQISINILLPRPRSILPMT